MMVGRTKVNMAMMPAPLLTRLCPCGPTPYYDNKSLIDVCHYLLLMKKRWIMEGQEFHWDLGFQAWVSKRP